MFNFVQTVKEEASRRRGLGLSSAVRTAEKSRWEKPEGRKGRKVAGERRPPRAERR